MSKLKTSLLALATAATVFGASSASAASFELWNGSAWVNNGVVSFLGPTSATYIGNSVPCDANFTVTVTGGAAAVTGAAFTGSAACNGIVAYTSPTNPWPMTPGSYSGANPPFTGAPTLTPTLWSVGITNVRIYIPAPLNVYCPSSTTTGVVNGVLDSANPNRFVFKATLGPCGVQTRASGALTATVPVRVVP